MMVLAFYGAGGLGMECSSLAERLNEREKRWEQFVFVDDSVKEVGELLGYPVMTFEQALETYGNENMEFMVAVGEVAVKKVIYEKLKAHGCKLTNMVHFDASVHRSVKMGEGVMLGKNACVGPKVEMGNNVLVRGNTVLGHDAKLGNNVEVCAFSIVGGNTVVGDDTFIGLHACLREGIKVGSHSIIGMGSVVTKDVPDNVVVYGNPAKVVRSNDAGRVFKKK
ncbi:MAG: NeuD/PglB/VioB family sugar acetyltransferase [Clostridia bacterium]|nr:NeuD/PglB/VioB family sugar acetyltransferase [Clostridia bacterium]